MRELESFVAPQGHELCYVDVGDRAGPAVLLLHSLGTDHRMWDQQLERLLAHGHRVVAADSRGHGASGWRPLESRSGWLEDIEALLGFLDIDSVDVWGISMGSVQALALARERPDVVRSIVVSGAIGGLPPDVAAAKVSALTEGPEAAGMERWARAYVEDTLVTGDVATRNTVEESVKAVELDAYQQSARACFQFRPGELEGISTPTLIIWGTEDHKTPRRLSERIADELESASIVELPRAGHLANLDQPDRFGDLAAAFVAAHQPGRDQPGAEPPTAR